MIAGPAWALTLEQALSLGKTQSLQLQGPRIDKEKTDGQVREAWSNALPQVDGLLAYQRYWKAPVIFFPSFDNSGDIMAIKTQQDNNAMGQITLTQPVYTFGRIGAGLKAAYAARRSNELLIRNNDQTLELDVMRRFWTVLLLRDLVDVRRNSLAVSDSALQKVQRLRDAGLMSDYDVLRSRVQVNNQIPQLQQAQNNLRLAEMSLKDLLGVPLDTALEVEGQLTDFAVPLEADTSTPQLAARSDLEALRDLSTLFQNVYVINRNARLPILAGTLNYSWQWTNNRWAINPHNNASSVYGGLALTIPIWSSGRVSGKAQQAKADWRTAQLNLKKAERGARLQYEAAISSYQTALANQQAASLTVEQAQQARAIAGTKLAQGQITPLEMDAAQLDELVARVSLAQAHFDRLVAASEARLALGLNPYSK
jgi:HAE1 family hydrophobic/amphiphilic exporter-1